MRCQDSNPWPLNHESSPITTRPVLRPIYVNLITGKYRWLCGYHICLTFKCPRVHVFLPQWNLSVTSYNTKYVRQNSIRAVTYISLPVLSKINRYKKLILKFTIIYSRSGSKSFKEKHCHLVCFAPFEFCFALRTYETFLHLNLKVHMKFFALLWEHIRHICTSIYRFIWFFCFAMRTN